MYPSQCFTINKHTVTLCALFTRLFETHPEVQSVFLPFRGKSHEDLQDSPQLKSHALRVMGTVETCMNHIHQLQELHQTLHDLGARHVMYNAKVDYIDVGGERCHVLLLSSLLWLLSSSSLTRYSPWSLPYSICFFSFSHHFVLTVSSPTFYFTLASLHLAQTYHRTGIR